MKIALLFSSKAGMAATVNRRPDETVVRGRRASTPTFSPSAIPTKPSRPWPPLCARGTRSFPSKPTRRPTIACASLRPDLVFNIAERLVGPNRESHIPTVCEILDMPYTGSDPLTLGLCLDKSRAKEILSYHGIPNPAFWIVEPGRGRPRRRPPAGHRQAALRGLEQGHQEQLRRPQPGPSSTSASTRSPALYKQPVIVERFLAGREFTVGVLGNASELRDPADRRDRLRRSCRPGPTRSIPTKPSGSGTRRTSRSTSSSARPTIPAVLKARIENVVAATCRVLRIRDWCRIDVRLDEKGEPNILEVNPLPGILPNPEDNSCLPKAARTAGYSYSDLILRVVEEAKRRPATGSGRDMSRHRKSKRILVGIAYNAYDPMTGRKVERPSEESVEQTAKEVLTAVTELGYAAFIIPLQKSFMNFLQRLKTLNADVLINLCEAFLGQPQLEANVAGGLRAPGPVVHRQRLADPGPLPEQVQDQGRAQVVRPADARRPCSSMPADQKIELPFPLIVKPNTEDASLGIYPDSVVRDEESLRKQVARDPGHLRSSRSWSRLHRGPRVQRRGHGRSTSPKPCRSRRSTSRPCPRACRRICSYEAKWFRGHPLTRRRRRSARRRSTTRCETKLQELAVKAFRACGCRDYARVDFRMDEKGRPFILEVNPNPDISLNAGYARALAAAGIDYKAFWGS